MIDASFTVAPRQRNTREENEKIKMEKAMNCGTTSPIKILTKDIDARWTKKTEKNFMVIKIMQK